MSLKLIRKPGRSNWYIRGTIRGIAIRESTGVVDRKAAATIRARREWELIERSIHGAQATATFIEAAVGYMEGGGERRFLGRIIGRLGSVPLAKIDQTLVEKTGRALYPAASPATLNRQLYTLIAAVLHHAAKRGLCAPRALERPAQPKGRVRWITFEEAERLIDACPPRLRSLVMFLFGTGARLSEALYVDWRNVDLVRGHVVFVDTKNGEHRGVPLHARIVDLLRELPHREGAVFRTRTGHPYAQKDDNSGGQIARPFQAACRRAGIEDFSPHDCRHTWATWHYQANRDLIGLMKLGGWKSERMVLRNAHVNVEQLAPSIDKALAAWDGPKSAPASPGRRVNLRRIK